MQSGPTRFDPNSYAAHVAVSGRSQHRPKSEYGLAVEARQKRMVGTTTTSQTNEKPKPVKAPEQTSPQRWGGSSNSTAQPPSQRQAPQPSPPLGSSTPRQPAARVSPPRRSLLSSTSRTQSVPRALTSQPNKDAEDQDEDGLSNSASLLLSQLQRIVVDISRQMVDERRHARHLREHIRTLESAMEEQDVMLQELRRENARATQMAQQQYRPSRLSAPAPSSSIVAISAAEVDRYVLSEFDRCSPVALRSGSRAEARRQNPFDDVTPEVAAVLRSLSSQVLQLQRQLYEEGNRVPAAADSVEEQEPRRDSVRTGGAIDVFRSTSSSSAARGGVPSSFSAAHGMGGVPRGNSLRAEDRSSATTPTSQLPRSTASRASAERAAAPVAAAPPRLPPAESVSASSPTRSESTASVDRSVYEDAATILSDIRARYGL
uniref:Uncharacterized protein n=1 Tax=Angomonas deanei TaxID=59799 RepID=C6K3P7_9TRYP|nr:hypothetical protein CDFL6B12_09 [Angomonas deanei]